METNLQATILYKIGEVAAQQNGDDFLLIWRRGRGSELYQGIIGGNDFFWTLTDLTNGEIITYKENFYTVRNSNPIGNGFYYVECQHRTA